MSNGSDLFGLVGERLAGRYTIESVVARGGFGVVYRARHDALHTLHALKVLMVPPDLPGDAKTFYLQQFEEEARIIGQFDHPSVVRVTDFGVSLMPSGTVAPWMVLEWIEGETLAAYLAARRGLGGQSPRDCMELLRPVIDALAAAHEMGIVHRDLKPGNIMLVSEQVGARRTTRRAITRPRARLLDFGIAKVMKEGEEAVPSGQTGTSSLMVAFSPRYAAPEQASGTRTGPWTDVHALGLILTELLTDHPPYEGTDKFALNVQVMSPTRPTPARFGVDVGPWEALLAKAMALAPNDRFRDAQELLDALDGRAPVTSATATDPTLPDPRRSMVAQEAAALRGVSAANAEPADVSTLRPTASARRLGALRLSGRAIAFLGTLMLGTTLATIALLRARSASTSSHPAVLGASEAALHRQAAPQSAQTHSLASQSSSTPAVGDASALLPRSSSAPTDATTPETTATAPSDSRRSRRGHRHRAAVAQDSQALDGGVRAEDAGGPVTPSRISGLNIGNYVLQ